MKGLLRRQKLCLLAMTGKRVSLRRSDCDFCGPKQRAVGVAGCNLILSKGREYHFELSPKAPKTHILSLRASVFVLCERGNLSFNVLGGVLRRVFQFEWVKIPPSILPPKMKKNKNYFVILNGVKNLAFGDSGWSIEEGICTSSNIGEILRKVGSG